MPFYTLANVQKPGYRVVALVDGREVSFALCADTDHGWIECYPPGDGGQLVAINGNGDLCRAVLVGRVEVLFIPRGAAPFRQTSSAPG